ncbi:NAD-dependent epimerase/dehydratase family protein [Jiangella asiatica]|uniref:NAD-dependent epimerase/dehydratase family protein n=1 Tax=Jiangella asiatica TaxID=2530372 RepID=UPI0013A5CD9A|nr:NAD(P)-dependent oxidoreductase [Jiangella asiatica]
MSRTVLVTGAAGRLGRSVVTMLRSAGSAVVAVDRAPGVVDGVQVRAADLADPHAADTVVAGCDEVIHLAAIPGPHAAPAATVFANNTAVTFRVLHAAAARGIRTAVVASSVSAYGLTFGPASFSPRYVPIDEDHPLTPYDPYGLSKQVDEHTAAMIARSTGLTVVAPRFGWIATRDMVAERVRQVAADPGAGKSVRELWGYVELGDAARACVAALDVRDGHHSVNVLAPDSLSTTPTAQLVARFHPSTRIRAGLTGTASAWSGDRAARLLGLGSMWSWRDADALEGTVSTADREVPAGGESHEAKGES